MSGSVVLLAEIALVLDAHELLSRLLGELSLVLELLRVINDFAELSNLVSELHSLLHSVALLVLEVGEGSDLEEVVFDVLDDPGSSVLDQVVHNHDCLGDPPPLLRLALELLPEVLHDQLIVLPVWGEKID